MIHYSPKNLITSEEIEKLNKFSNKLKRNYVENQRNYEVYPLDSDDKLIFLQKIINWFEAEFNMSIQSHDPKNFESYLIFYNKNDFFAKHNDNSYSRQKNFKREYILGFHLNNDYEGGEFCVYQNESHQIIKNDPGLVYAIDSSLYHEVKPVKTGIRKSIVIFIGSINTDFLNITKKII